MRAIPNFGCGRFKRQTKAIRDTDSDAAWKEGPHRHYHRTLVLARDVGREWGA